MKTYDDNTVTKSTILGHPPRIKIKVEDDTISDAVRANSNHCMIAEALKKARPGLSHVAVDIQTIRATDKDKAERYCWLTPRSIQQAIVQFDMGHRPGPFMFELRDGQTTPSGHAYRRKRQRGTKQLRRPRNGSATSVLERVGGAMPPRSIGQRREFGLRKFQSGLGEADRK